MTQEHNQQLSGKRLRDPEFYDDLDPRFMSEADRQRILKLMDEFKPSVKQYPNAGITLIFGTGEDLSNNNFKDLWTK